MADKSPNRFQEQRSDNRLSSKRKVTRHKWLIDKNLREHAGIIPLQPPTRSLLKEIVTPAVARIVTQSLFHKESSDRCGTRGHDICPDFTQRRKEDRGERKEKQQEDLIVLLCALCGPLCVSA
jgi:hypothetical protein